MKKKIVFLDGDGTLWYPKATKRTRKPHWIYQDPETKDNHLEHLELTPNVKETLEALRKKGICLVAVSANPRSEEIAVQEIKERLEHFGLTPLFHAYRASDGDDPAHKGIIISEVLSSLGLRKEDALMVGDSYFYDYLAARNVGVDALFIENTVSKMPDEIPQDLQMIKEVNELLGILL